MEGSRPLKLKPQQSRTSPKRFPDETAGAKDFKPKILLQIPALPLNSQAPSGGSVTADENRDADPDSAERWRRPKESPTKEVTCRAQAWLTAGATSIC